MRHQVHKGRKFNRSLAHRRSLMRNLLTSLIEQGHLTTTISKAKELKSFSDNFFSRACNANLSFKRWSFSLITNKAVAERFYQEILPKFGQRRFGFTRVLKMGRRLSDGSERARIEFVEDKKEDDEADV